MQRALLPAALSDDPEAALRELMEKQQTELERLRREDPQRFLQMMIVTLLQTQDVAQKRTIVENTPELLTDQADTLLEQIAKAQENPQARQLVEQHRVLLQRCRAVGVEQAFAVPPSPRGKGAGGEGEIEAPPQLPDDLQERLRRAGVTDEESFQRALENDPQLAADLQAFLQANPQAVLAGLVQAFLSIQTSEQLRAFWRAVPTELEQPFIELVERLIAEAPPDTPAEALESLRARLRDFRELCEAARAARNIPPELREVLEELARRGVEIRSEEDLRRTLEENPDLRARLERAAQNMQGGPPIPPEFHQDIQQAQEGEARYTRTGDLNALNAAIAAWERILNHPAFARADERFRLAAWNDAGGAYLRRYWRMGDTTDLDKALNLWQ
ncbi:hypothetical protein [Chloroflexus aggregans]|uniref:Uncharacterized protein n=1 Tax=Chloroflexus aggregans (strain MD-66 / DSM 9485) TaxID=326427 RepID=B8G4Z0_CHLAD|nr:hypothetical protein [Chloroflexus aggregans]ACL23623.1 hypothetical protein Cagg_0694 [Chloroflexus aggregans DSM 9485]